MAALDTVNVAAADRGALLIGGLLASGISRAAQEEIVYADRRRLSYEEMGLRVSRLAAGLASIGVTPGDTVAVMDWDSHRYLECFYAVPMMGAVLHMINVRLSPEQILYTINHAEDDVILVNSEFLPLLEQIWDRVDAGKRLVLLDDSGRPLATRLPLVGEYEALLEAADADYRFPALDENARATTFYTTGTTGAPKGVTFCHRQLVLHTLCVQSALSGPGHCRFNAGDVYMPITPMFHVHAWGIPYVATLLGVKQVYPGRYVPAKLLETIRRESVTMSHCVPTILQMLLASPASAETDLRAWKVIVGGAALPQALARQAMERGIDLCTGYGMSETCPVLTLAHLEPRMESWDIDCQIEIRCRTGKPIPLVQLRIVDTDMRDVPHDGEAQGEVVVRAPWLTRGYLKDPANSERLWAGGWLHTGDLGVIGADGYLRVTDRVKDVIKSGGEWISSLQLEDLILAYPGVAEVAVIAVPDSRWSERPLAVVVARAGQTVRDTDIRKLLADHAAQGTISSYGVPERVVFVEALPRTSVGKLDKKRLREIYAG